MSALYSIQNILIYKPIACFLDLCAHYCRRKIPWNSIWLDGCFSKRCAIHYSSILAEIYRAMEHYRSYEWCFFVTSLLDWLLPLAFGILMKSRGSNCRSRHLWLKVNYNSSYYFTGLLKSYVVIVVYSRGKFLWILVYFLALCMFVTCRTCNNSNNCYNLNLNCYNTVTAETICINGNRQLP